MYINSLVAEKKIYPPQQNVWNTKLPFSTPPIGSQIEFLPVLLPLTSPAPHLIFQLQTHLPFLLLVICCYLWFQSIAMEGGRGKGEVYNLLNPFSSLAVHSLIRGLLAKARKPNHLDDNYKFFARPFVVLSIL